MIEVILVLLLLIFTYFAKIYFDQKNRHRIKQGIKLAEKILQIIQKPPDNTQNKKIQMLRHHLPILLDVLPVIEKKDNLPYWSDYRSKIIKQILQPCARKLAYSRFFTKRFRAVNCYHYGIEQQDLPAICKLLRDDVLLISLSSAAIAVQTPMKQTINTLIDCFSKGRRLQQSLFTDNLYMANPTLVPMVLERLEHEENPYTRAFCYRFLDRLPHQNLLPPPRKDLDSDIIDLRIAALNYFTHQAKMKPEQLRTYLNNKMWQVRLKAIQLLTELNDQESIPLIGELLCDKEWWVRINASHSLAKFGEKGIAILRAQNPKVDQYAYEAATQVLLTLKKEEEN